MAAVLHWLSWSDEPAVKVKVDIESFHPEVKASKSVEQFQRDSQITVSPYAARMRSCLSLPMKSPVTKFWENTASLIVYCQRLIKY